MKILFAISNENVLNKIVNSYKNKYNDSVSFKNVFYFNAIIREIQKDKTYDRIVISEDLEPFSNNNYDIIDKFIVERLKEISNEAENNTKRTDIIVICTDRRTKSSFVLTKMFEYKIYNALVGTDRRIDNVCDLIYNPRTEFEAKEYYKIGSSTETQTIIDDVSEQEVQNILIHYKKLGKNEDRYADSFNNIASQYTDNQLKIIIKCLPINVKAVLEAECPKYQELVTYTGETEKEKKERLKIQEQRKLEQIEQERKLKEKIEKEKAKTKKVQKNISEQEEANIQATQKEPEHSSGIDILDQKRSQARMTGNVIIPNNMDVRNERKIYSDEQLSQISNIPRQEKVEQIKPQKQEIIEPVQEDPIVGMQLPGLEDIELPTSPIKDVEPEETILPEIEDNIAIAQNIEKTTQLQMEEISSQPEISQEPKRGRGRPRKTTVEPPKPKGKRGRPRKNPLPEEVSNQVEPQQPVQKMSQAQQIQSAEQTKPVQSIPEFEPIQNIQQVKPVQSIPEIDEFDDILSNLSAEAPKKTLNNAETISKTELNDISLPGLDIDEEDDIISNLPGIQGEEDDIISSLPGIENENYTNTQNSTSNNQFENELYTNTYTPPSISRISEQQEAVNQYSSSKDRIESIKKLEENRVYSSRKLKYSINKR